MNSADTPLLECRSVSKRFVDGNLTVDVLKEVDVSMFPGQSLAIIGASGSGKSTLMHILGGLSAPTSGSVSINGRNIYELSEKVRGTIRNYGLGFIYQFHHLLPEFSALENVAMPLLIRRQSGKKSLDAAAAMLDQVGLGHRLKHKPGELSGGERQRTAIARALVTHPDCVLADEPTGNLDNETATQVFDLMLKMSREHGTSLIMVTHDRQLASRLDTTAEIRDGLLISH